MVETKLPSWIYRWRVAFALCSGSLVGGLVLDVLHMPSAIATGAAMGVSAGIFYGLRK